MKTQTIQISLVVATTMTKYTLHKLKWKIKKMFSPMFKKNNGIGKPSYESDNFLTQKLKNNKYNYYG